MTETLDRRRGQISRETITSDIVPVWDQRLSRRSAGSTDRAELVQQQETVRLVAILLLSCMIFGRFVIPFGGSSTSLAGVTGLLVAGFGTARGILTLDRRRLIVYLTFVGLVLISAAANELVSNPFAQGIGWLSMLQFLIVSGFATLTFRRPIEEEIFFRTVNGCFTFIAVTGLLQFIVQFAGISIFRFSNVIPPQFLTELFTGGGYNNEILIGIGAWCKSNGFFLAEPSIFSQFMAVATAIETLYFRRRAFLVLYLAALLVSASGTGWIVLAVFVATVGVSMGRKGILIAVGLSVGTGVALMLWAVLLPDFFAVFIARWNETADIGSSGYIRFVTPFLTSGHILDRAPWALLVGVGSSVSEHIWVSYEGAIDTPIKIAMENGIPVLVSYLLLISLGHQTSRQGRLVPALLLLLTLAGSYAQFPPVLFPILLITPVASLRSIDQRQKRSRI